MFWFATGFAAEPALRTNVLMIVADDLGTDKLSGYGEHPNPPNTPVLDTLARQGVRFDNAYAYPMCSPTRAAILTGRYGRRDGLGAIVTWPATWELPLREVLLSEVLHDNGYATAMIGKWHLSGPRTPSAYRHPNLQGFDHAAGSINNLYFEDEGRSNRAAATTNYFRWERFEDGTEAIVDTYATATTTKDALSWVQGAAEPWFLYVAYNSAHAPFHVPPGASIPANAPAPVKYAAMVEDLDREVGRLLGGLPTGQREHTLVVFVADNGTPHGVVTPPRDPAHGKGSLFEGGVNVPLIVAGPGVTPGVSQALVHVVDLLPTVRDRVGVPTPLSTVPLDGVSFVEVLTNPASPGPRKFVYCEKFGPAGPPPYRDPGGRSVRDDRYKLIVDRTGAWFYDLQGRDDDGPGRPPESLVGDERARYEALAAELARLERDLTFAY